MRKYLLLAFTLSIALLVMFAQRLTVATPQSGNASTTDLQANNALSMIGPSPTMTPTVTSTVMATATATETPTVTPTPTNIDTYFPSFRFDPTPTPTNTPIPTNTPTVVPSPTSQYPLSPWLLQDGETTYQYNPSMYWIQGSIKWPDGERIIGFHVQICDESGEQCSGPSDGSREEHMGIEGYYDWVGFNGGLSHGGGDGKFFAFVADCTNYEGSDWNPTIGSWPRCEEHSERVYFEIDRPDKSVVTVNWVLVDPTRD